MLYAVGFQAKDFAKPQVAIASTWSMVTPCNMHLDVLAREAAGGANAAEEKPPSSTPSPFRTAFPWGPKG